MLNGLSRSSGMINHCIASGDRLCDLAQSFHGPETQRDQPHNRASGKQMKGSGWLTGYSEKGIRGSLDSGQKANDSVVAVCRALRRR